MFILPLSLFPPMATQAAQAAKATTAAKATAAAGTIPSQLNLSIPSSPAADLLGLTGNNITQVTSLQQLTDAALTGGNSSSTTSTGYDYTFSAQQLGLIHTKVNLGRYFNAKSGLERGLYSLQLSLAVANTPDLPQLVSKAAAAVGMPLFDRTDWRIDSGKVAEYTTAMIPYLPNPITNLTGPAPTSLGDAYLDIGSAVGDLQSAKTALTDSKAAKVTLSQADMDNLDAALAAVQAVQAQHPAWRDQFKAPLAGDDLTAFQDAATKVATFAKAYYAAADKVFQAQAKTEATKISDETWNRQRLSIAAGGASQSQGNTAFSSQGFGSWASYQYPVPMLFGVRTATLLYAKYFNDISEKFSTMTSAANLKGYTLAARWQGGSSSFDGFIEYEYQQGKPTAGGAIDYDHVCQVGMEQKFGNQWLQLGIGKSLQNGHSLLFELQFATNFSTSRTLSDEGVPVKVTNNP